MHNPSDCNSMTQYVCGFYNRVCPLIHIPFLVLDLISLFASMEAQLNHVFEKADSVDTVYSFKLIPSYFLPSFLDSWSPRLGISHLELQKYNICLHALCYRS